MANHETKPALILKIENAIPNLSKSERVVAGYIVENPEQVVYLSVAALADSCGVSDPTVVRMCQKLGFTGYQSLKLAMAAAVVSPTQTVHEAIHSDDDIKAVTEKVFQSAIYALQFTRETLDFKAMEDAAQALIKANRIVIFGMGASGSSSQASATWHECICLYRLPSTSHRLHISGKERCCFCHQSLR